MEKNLPSKYETPDSQASSRDGYMKESRRLGYHLKHETTNVSNPDGRSEMIRDANTFPSRSSELPQKQQDDEKDRHNEELVRYMSNLPSFLKKDVKLNEKTFSVGVLDWKILEKWQHFHDIGINNSSAHYDISSRPSSGRSSYRSSSCHSLSPARQKLRYPTLQSHFYGTASEKRCHDIESSEVNKLKAEDRKAVPSGLSGVQQTAIKTHLPSDLKADYRVNAFMAKDLKVAKSSIARKSQSLDDAREKMTTQASESLRRHQMTRTSYVDRCTTDEVYSRKQETPKYEHGNKYPHIHRSLNLTGTKKIGSKNASHNREASFAEPFHNMPPSVPPRESDQSHSHIKEPCSGAYQDKKISNDLSRRFTDSGDVSVNARWINMREGKTISVVEDQVLINSSIASKTKKVSSGTPKVRNPSPTQRFGFSFSWVGKVSSSSAALTVSQPRARNPIGTSGPEEVGLPSSSLNSSKVNSKGRSSPLRRLLEPLMGPARASLSDSRLREPASKSSEDHGESTAHSVKLKLDLKSCKTVEAEVPRCSGNHGSPTMQALLQVAVRNGFPLFTFAVDNKNDILAATVRKPISGREDFSCIYSFYIVHEMKKKNGGWISHGKDKVNTLVPNIVAQMKVTDSFKENSIGHSTSKEHVLFSYDTKKPDTSDHDLNDELAAVVVKILKKSTCNSGAGNIGENQTEDRLNMTVILPGGHHGQPIKGKSSSLVKRWQSGGLCDCGGWDLGCRMRVLSDNAQSRQRSSSAKPKNTNKLLELFSQDEDQKPAFSLAPFKDGIYAVEFNSSIEILQAFSISLSILSCFKPVEFVETSNGLENKSSADNIVSVSSGRKVYAKKQTIVPAFIPNRPLSPVGRV